MLTKLLLKFNFNVKDKKRKLSLSWFSSKYTNTICLYRLHLWRYCDCVMRYWSYLHV